VAEGGQGHVYLGAFLLALGPIVVRDLLLGVECSVRLSRTSAIGSGVRPEAGRKGALRLCTNASERPALRHLWSTDRRPPTAAGYWACSARGSSSDHPPQGVEDLVQVVGALVRVLLMHEHQVRSHEGPLFVGDVAG
jgi:hypothetical protein